MFSKLCQVDKSAGFVSCKIGIQKGILNPLPKCPLVWQAWNRSFWTLRVGAIGLQTTSHCMAAAPMVFKHTLALWIMYSSESAFHAFVVLTTAWRLKPTAGPSPWKLPFVRDYAWRAPKSRGETHLRVSQSQVAESWDLEAHSRLPTLERGRGSSWEPKD